MFQCLEARVGRATLTLVYLLTPCEKGDRGRSVFQSQVMKEGPGHERGPNICNWPRAFCDPIKPIQISLRLLLMCDCTQQCDEEKLLGHLGVVLYEYLGEEYPEVLGSILGALKSIVNVIGMNRMTPPIKDLLPRLTPILKNRHEKVQENCIVSPPPVLFPHYDIIHLVSQGTLSRKIMENIVPTCNYLHG